MATRFSQELEGGPEELSQKAFISHGVGDLEKQRGIPIVNQSGQYEFQDISNLKRDDNLGGYFFDVLKSGGKYYAEPTKGAQDWKIFRLDKEWQCEPAFTPKKEIPQGEFPDRENKSFMIFGKKQVESGDEPMLPENGRKATGKAGAITEQNGGQYFTASNGKDYFAKPD